MKEFFPLWNAQIIGVEYKVTTCCKNNVLRVIKRGLEGLKEG